VAKAKAEKPQAPQPQAPAGGKVTESWQDVESGMISAYRYDPAERILEVKFTSGQLYTYVDVPPDVVQGLRDAESKGSYMHSAIIDVFPYHVGRKSTRR
jgi:hypothetical protein